MPTLSPGATRGLLIICVTLLLAVGAAGCGGARSSPVVVRVGTVTIDRAAVDHWAKAVELGSPLEGALGRSSSTPRQEALEFLISSNWAIGAAAEHGLAVSDSAVARGLKERIDGAPNGRAEFEREAESTGQTLADVKLEVKAALALAALRELVSRSVQPVTATQVADYYRTHLQRFRIPDRRWVDLIEAIPSYAHAVALGKELGTGKRFAKRALRELVAYQTPYEAAHSENPRLVHAIFAAVPGRVARPVRFNNHWVLMVVRKLVPGSTKSLSEVRAEIVERLAKERHRLALASFVEAYGRDWTAKTRCRGGFVVQKCSEYRGRLTSEGDLLAGE